jgi:glycosyltransferase involved in cell wall biosynthesis
VDASGSAHPLHSTVDPRREARRLIDSLDVDLEEKTFLILLGLGGGYYAEAALARDDVSLVLVIEYDLDAVAGLLASMDYTRVFRDTRFHLLVDPDAHAIEACIAGGRKLIIAGSGAKKNEIRRYQKSPLIRFVGGVDDEEKASLFSRARALLFPGIEDLGLVPVEANAAGCPVIAFRKGGALDTVKEGVTGLFFDEQTPRSLVDALDRFEKVEYSFCDRLLFTEHVKQFSQDVFKTKMLRITEERIRVK